MDDRAQQARAAGAKLRIKVPGLKKSLGAGDVVRKVTESLGIEHCSECERRQRRMNRFLAFEAASKEDES
jgi:hypothetical protein